MNKAKRKKVRREKSKNNSLTEGYTKLYNKVYSSRKLSELIKKYPDAYAYAAFFILQLPSCCIEKQQLDFQLRDGIAVFSVVGDKIFVAVEQKKISEKLPKLPESVNTDLSAVLKKLKAENKRGKLVAILYVRKKIKKAVWECIITSGEKIEKTVIDSYTGKVLTRKYINLYDVLSSNL